MEPISLSIKKYDLPRAGKMVNLHRRSMAEKIPPKSEGEELASFLKELESDQRVQDISGWECGFPNLSRALDGIRSGLYLLIGPPASGKSSFAKQFFDQVVSHNQVVGVFFSFADQKKEIRIKTLARLSGVENREIRRGGAYLLHWYGVPKAQDSDTKSLPPGWEKLRKSAEEAKAWLDLTYLFECPVKTALPDLVEQIREVRTMKNIENLIAVIDDCQRLGISEFAASDRLTAAAEHLQGAALTLDLPILAVWPELSYENSLRAEAWAEKLPAADVVLVLEPDKERTEKLIEPNQAITLHIVKNRGGEKGKLAFEFFPAFSRFVETATS